MSWFHHEHEERWFLELVSSTEIVSREIGSTLGPQKDIDSSMGFFFSLFIFQWEEVWLLMHV